MAAPTFKTAGKTETSSTDNRVRKEVFANVDPVCWIKDYEKEIDVRADGRYYNRYDKAGTQQEGNDPVKYKIYVPAKSNTPIVIEVRFFLISLLNADQEKIIFDKMTKSKMAEKYSGPKGYKMAVKAVCESAIQRLLDNKLSIKITDPACDSRTFKLAFKVAWAESEASCHYKFNVHDTIERESVAGDVVSIALATDRHTHAHEYLHCIGLPDEYSYHKTDEELIRYYQPDALISAAIIGVPDLVPRHKETISILNSDDGTLEPRHGFAAAIEIQKLLKAETGRDMTCEVLKS